MYKVKLSERALEDIFQGVDYYEEIRAGLGLRFQNEVFEHFGFLKKIPLAFSVKIKKEYRELPLKVFPYVIIYKVDVESNLVLVYRIFHVAQNPTKK